jgi:hypothetical protein
MANSILFLSSIIFTLSVLYHYFNNMFFNLNLLVGITSITNHGLTNELIKKIDRVYVPIYLSCMYHHIYSSCYDEIIKILIYVQIFSGIICATHSIYLRNNNIDEKHITMLHLYGHFVLIYVFNFVVYLDKYCSNSQILKFSNSQILKFSNSEIPK